MSGARRAAIARNTVAASAAIVAVCLFAVQCGQAPTGPTPSSSPTPTVPDPNAPVTPPITSGPVLFSGAGDIGDCDGTNANHDGTGHEATARMLRTLGGRIFTTGDNAYAMGTSNDFNNCYNRYWGEQTIRDRTYPAPGNHDYGNDSRTEANAYFTYFGINAGPFGLGYHSYDYGDWHIIQLNSNFNAGVGVDTGSAQMNWLLGDLQANRAKCTLAYWHHPLFTSGPNGTNPRMRAIFRTLYEANVDLVITGHDHIYERFAPQDPDGRPDAARGIRQITVGTGGHSMLPNVTSRAANSESIVTGQHGILKLTLSTDNYSWEYVTVNGAVRDASPAPVACH